MPKVCTHLQQNEIGLPVAVQVLESHDSFGLPVSKGANDGGRAG